MHPRQAKSGYTLLELLAATVITGTVLVATLALLRDAMALSRRVEAHNMLTTLCVSKMEEHVAEQAATFTSNTAAGDFASQGRPQLRYRVMCSDNPTNGGIPNRLMSVSAAVWDDANNNNSQDAGELSVNLNTKVAKMAVYQNEAKGP